VEGKWENFKTNYVLNWFILKFKKLKLDKFSLLTNNSASIEQKKDWKTVSELLF
jgi:hypothetical protein